MQEEEALREARRKTCGDCYWFDDLHDGCGGGVCDCLSSPAYEQMVSDESDDCPSYLDNEKTMREMKEVWTMEKKEV